MSFHWHDDTSNSVQFDFELNCELYIVRKALQKHKRTPVITVPSAQTLGFGGEEDLTFNRQKPPIEKGCGEEQPSAMSGCVVRAKRR